MFARQPILGRLLVEKSGHVFDFPAGRWHAICQFPSETFWALKMTGVPAIQGIPQKP